MHKLLRRQLRKAGLDPSMEDMDPAWVQLLEHVDRTYVEADEGRYLLERSLMLTSQEMQGLYESLRLASETRIAAERDKLRAVLTSLGDGLCILNGDGRVVSVNPAGEGVLGQKARDCAGRLFDELVTIRSADDEISAAGLIAANEPLRDDDGVFVSRDGRTVPVAFTFTPILRDAPLHGAVLVARDVSDRKAAETREAALRNQLDRARRLESLGVLAGGIAHDLNNILGPIVAYPDLFREELPAGSPLLDDVAEIEEAVRRAVAVLQDLLALSRHSGGRLTRIELGNRVRHWLRGPEWAALTSRYPSLEIEADVCADGAWVESTVGHITRSLHHLVHHAAQAMRGRGRLEVTVETRRISTWLEGYERIPPGDYVVLSITDQSPALGEVDLERLFEPFYAKQALGHAGTGLGLAVVYALVRDARGHLDVQASSEGSRFDIYLPACGAPTRERPRASRGSGERILVVDDIAGQRALARRLLTNLGYQPQTVSNGREAVEFVAGAPVDVVLVDMVMEDDFDGCDTLRAIRRLRPNQRCLIASGFADNDRVREALAIGAAAYLPKPYTREALAEAIRTALDA